MRKGQEGEDRDLVKTFTDWSEKNSLLLNTTKTKEMVEDFRRSKPPPHPRNIQGRTLRRWKHTRVLKGAPGQ